jgi:hypothetical protein
MLQASGISEKTVVYVLEKSKVASGLTRVMEFEG